MQMDSTDNSGQTGNSTLVQYEIPAGTFRHKDPIPADVSLSGTVLGIGLIATEVFGNILVILSLVLNKHLCKASNVFIISLAVRDIFQNIAVKPLHIHT